MLPVTAVSMPVTALTFSSPVSALISFGASTGAAAGLTSGGGVFGALKRVAGGGSLFMTEYRAVQYMGEVAFAAKVPGHIVPVEIGPGQPVFLTGPAVTVFEGEIEL